VKYTIVTIIILSSSDTASLSSLMICRTTVATFNLSLSDELGPVLIDPFSEFPVVADAAERGAASFSHLSAVPVVAVVAYLDAVHLRRAVLVR
jgi:hypothetical protein